MISTRELADDGAHAQPPSSGLPLLLGHRSRSSSVHLQLDDSIDSVGSPVDYDKPLPHMPSVEADSDACYDGDKSSEVRQASWVDLHTLADASSDRDPEYLRPHHSAALSPSPYTGDAVAARPRAPTPSASPPPVHDAAWLPEYKPSAFPAKPHTTRTSMISPPTAYSIPMSPLVRSASEPESAFQSNSPPFTRPSNFSSAALPDPSQFPDPYPFRPPHHHMASTPPALSSGGSSSASTRSSAYTSSCSALASGDYGHVYVASGEGEDEMAGIGVGITSDSVVHLMDRDMGGSSMSSATGSRTPIERTASYAGSTRSQPYSASNSHRTNSLHDFNFQTLRAMPSYDNTWQPDERDEIGLTSDDETDFDDLLGPDQEDVAEKRGDERTAAIVVAEEGRGLIVRGEEMSVVDLRVQRGTTHLLVGSSTTPNLVPTFLTNTLPAICETLLALDISANFLGALPPALVSCVLLEELNIASNPLRALPIFLSQLTSLRVLIADSTGITTLPSPLSALEKVNTLSLRRNKMHALPSWLCLLTSLETLLVEGNPFQGPWKALLEPLMAKTPTTPLYPPTTPFFPLRLGTGTGFSSLTGSDSDVEDASEPPSAVDEEHTITTSNAPPLSQVSTSAEFDTAGDSPRKLGRTRTTPNRSHFEKNRPTLPASSPRLSTSPRSSAKQVTDSGYFGEVRRMRSADEMRRVLEPTSASLTPPNGSPKRPTLAHYATSASNSKQLGASIVTEDVDLDSFPKRYASLGVAKQSTRSASGISSRAPLTASLFSGFPVDEENGASEIRPSISRSHSTRQRAVSPALMRLDPEREAQGRLVKEEKDKQGRWGFFKKMSMGKMKQDASPGSSRPSTAQGRPPISAPTIAGTVTTNTAPRISTPSLGDLDLSSRTPSRIASSVPNPPVMSKISTDVMKIPSVSSPASGLLAPPSPVAPRSGKRRSFLPLDIPPPLIIPIPNSAAFVAGIAASNGLDDQDDNDLSILSPTTAVDSPDDYLRREEDRAREASARGLRSVMAYLKDMSDLSLSSQANTLSMHSSPTLDGESLSRRPTLGAAGRIHSDASLALSSNTSPPSIPNMASSDQLRSLDSIARMRNGGVNQTISVATTDSCESSGGEERKYKDDKTKRAMIVREIVETERTYVKSLQELVDIYVKPASTPVNKLGIKETVVPAAERKVVFNGLDALFSFHKASFLPALEHAAASLLKPASAIAAADADGKMSSDVANAVGSVFISHAAFMKMYSTYINNFDNSVQRVKYWISDRPGTGSSKGSSSLTSSSSTAQLAGLAMSMSTITTGIPPEGSSILGGMSPLSSSQRKRIKSYLKRCRLNPNHSQLNLEGYLLLPVQRVPRYRLLLNELVTSTPPTNEYLDNPLERALTEISSLAINMNEGKRESESRRKLVQWQARIRGKFPSPLVQPHRRLIMDGKLLLTRVVRKSTVSFDVVNSEGDFSSVQVECLAPELTPRPLVGILCNDLLVLCRDTSEGQDPKSPVDLWAVLRMQTLPQPASIVHGNALRLVDNKAILYFDTPSTSEALTWYRAINLHIPASKA